MILSSTLRARILRFFDPETVAAIEQASDPDDAISRVAELTGQDITDWDVSRDDGAANSYYARRNPRLHFRMLGEDFGELTLISYDGALIVSRPDETVDACVSQWESVSYRSRCAECGEWADGGTSGCCQRDDDEPEDSHRTDARKYHADRSARLASYV